MSSFQVLRDRIDAHYPLYIDGRWTDAEDGATLEVLCPANGQPLCHVAAAAQADVDRAVAAARTAFPAWRSMPLMERARVMNALYGRIAGALETLTVAESLETGRPLALTRSLVTLGTEQLPRFGGILRTCEDGVRCEIPGVHAMRVREPMGVIAIRNARNLPLLLGLWYVAPALAAGNSVVLKPSRHAPVGTMELMKAIADLLPPGVLNILSGESDTIDPYLIAHPGIDGLVFADDADDTGDADVRAGNRAGMADAPVSVSGNRAGMAAAPVGVSGNCAGVPDTRAGLANTRISASEAQHILPVNAHMLTIDEPVGGSAGICFADIALSDMPNAVQAIVDGCILSGGQSRAMHSRVLIQESIYDWVVMRVAKALEKIRIGPPWQADAQMGPIASEAHFIDLLRYVRLGQEEGARLVQGGVRLTGDVFDRGFYVAPTALADVNPSMRVAREAVHGPVLCLMRFKTEAQAIQIANDAGYNLSGGIYTGDLRRGLRVAEALHAENVNINRAGSTLLRPAAACMTPPIGRARHRAVFDAFCRIKTIAF